MCRKKQVYRRRRLIVENDEGKFPLITPQQKNIIHSISTTDNDNI